MTTRHPITSLASGEVSTCASIRRFQQEADAIMADLEARNILYPVSDDLPPAAASVRLPGGMVGEVVLWFDRNPDRTQWFSGLRVVLVELVDSVIEHHCTGSLDHKSFTEDDITFVRSQPSEAAMQRWLKRWHRLRPELKGNTGLGLLADIHA